MHAFSAFCDVLCCVVSSPLELDVTHTAEAVAAWLENELAHRGINYPFQLAAASRFGSGDDDDDVVVVDDDDDGGGGGGDDAWC